MLTEFAITKFISFLTHSGGGCSVSFCAKYYPYISKCLTDFMTLHSLKNPLLFHYFGHLYNYRNEWVLPAAPCLLALSDTSILCCLGHRFTVVFLYRRLLILLCLSKYLHLLWVCFKAVALCLLKSWQSTCLSRDQDRWSMKDFLPTCLSVWKRWKSSWEK